MIGKDTHVHRHHMPHLTRPEKTYFVTFVAHGRTTLSEVAREIALESCLKQDTYCLHCAVVMPDHVHLVLTPNVGTVLSNILQAIKGVSSHRINRALGTSGRVWQRESFDRILRWKEVPTKIRYVLENPVRAGLVAEYTNWPWHYQRDESV